MTKKRAGDGQDADLVDSLYAASPKEFVAERKRVRDALVAAGRAAEAREVAKRKRPTASVWAVNQLARRAPDEIDALLELGASLRAGERKLLRGGDVGDFMDEARTARQKVAALARRADAFIEESGQKPTVALGRKIAQTLQAASIADDETRARLAAGRIDEDLAPPSSFGAGGDLATTLAASLAGNAKSEHAAHERKHAAAHERKHATAHERKHAAADERKHAAADERKHAAAERKHAAAERKRAASELRAERRARAAARKQAAAFARAAAAADRVVAERTRDVERARAAVERAETELRAAKDALADAETAAAAARRAADEADGYV